MAKNIQVMIVDDHLVVREGLKQLLESGDDIKVIAEADSGFECLKILEKKSPDIIFMDVRMPGISGIETTRLVCEKYANIKVIMLTIYDDEDYILQAVQAGAKGYVLKKVQKNELIKIVHHIMDDKAFLDSMVTSKIFNRLKREPHRDDGQMQAALTQRELQVLKGIVAGHTDRLIAKTLFISENTVRSHIKRIYIKLGVSSKAKAVSKALQNKLIIGEG